jgi:hypothetical protein
MRNLTNPSRIRVLTVDESTPSNAAISLDV